MEYKCFLLRVSFFFLESVYVNNHSSGDTKFKNYNNVLCP